LPPLAPPSLRCIWAPYGWNDAYRDRYYHGGILSYGFMRGWLRNVAGMQMGDERLALMRSRVMHCVIEELRADPEIAAVPFLAECLAAPDTGTNPLMVEILAHCFDGPFWRERSIDFSQPIDVPATLGGCWGIYGLHLPGAFRAFEHWRGPKRMLIGPPVYLDRPVYQYQYDQLRWFDHWLKDNDTGILDESPVQTFIDNSSGEWKDSESWPQQAVRFTPFHLHDGGLLSEREPFRGSGTTSFDDAPGAHSEVRFVTPPMVEATELCGPIALKLFASTTDAELLIFASLIEIAPDGAERLLTRGWLRGSQRRTDPSTSRPWQPFHTHRARERLIPGEVEQFDVEIRPYGILLQPGYRLALRLKCADDDKPQHDLQWIAQGHLHRPVAATVTIHHSLEYPSSVLLPVTRGKPDRDLCLGRAGVAERMKKQNLTTGGCHENRKTCDAGLSVCRVNALRGRASNRANLPRPSDPRNRAVSGGWRARYADARDRREGARRAWSAVDHREQARRQRFRMACSNVRAPSPTAIRSAR
jgi:predicted acyl esterase